MTARGAVQRLVQEGLVYRVPGRGTFVAPSRANRTASHILSFSDEMRRRGTRAVVAHRRAAAPARERPTRRADSRPTRCSCSAACGRPTASRLRSRRRSSPPGAWRTSSTATSAGRRCSRRSPQPGSYRPRAVPTSAPRRRRHEDAQAARRQTRRAAARRAPPDPRPGRRTARARRRAATWERATASTSTSTWSCRRDAGDHRGGRVTRRIDELRAGVVGTGFIGVVHVDALRRLGRRGHRRRRLDARARGREAHRAGRTRATRRCSPTTASTSST